MSYKNPDTLSAATSSYAQLFAHRRLTKTGTTLWDTSSIVAVLHKKRSEFHVLICAALVFVALILMSVLNAAGK